MGLSFELVTISIMLAVTAIFAAYEMALASISRVKLTALVNMKKAGAVEALYMKDRMERSLAVVQVSVTLMGAIAAAIGGAGVDGYLSPILSARWGVSSSVSHILSLIFLIIPLSAITIVFAELVPKTYAIKHQVMVCLALSPLMKVLAWLAYPVISILEKIVKQVMEFIDRHQRIKDSIEDNTGLHELNAAVSLARTSRLLGVHEERIVLSAAQLSRRMIKEIILPVEDISMIPLNAKLSEALIRAHNDMHTRFPVSEQEDNPQRIIGYVNFKDIVAALKINPNDPSVKGILRPIKTVQANVSISLVLEQMITEKLHIMMVAVQERMIGMVTLEDIIEELVGEIEDEYDRVPSYVHPYGDGWLLGGGVTMSTLASTVGKVWPLLSPEEEKVKLADWFAKNSKAPLKAGDCLEVNGVQITARRLRRKKLGEAAVHLKENV
ncbi:MAG: DUF21 domain-containing protein [Candidatus Omnitrophica bacterium]|nr:DUF21 domain-containing protein [Candidatus Omnitrophota bacterium]